MYHHLLLPTDGSPLSEKAVRRGLRLARDLGAKATGFYAMPEFRAFAYSGTIIEDTQAIFEEQANAQAEAALGFIKTAAQEEGVSCDTARSTSDRPYEAILEAAHAHGCDLIVMASHGRRGIEGLLMGSETQKVLTHGKISVLVDR
ncbi:universal stress protein [Simplicispira psychrophila]|uniref:universal stress protein n=1 Tax=Simplicispira psychrophila TaxID=80882 RepID=UPI000480686C|nr:universal stress protein [Simplicispira psychrophila]